MTTGIYGDPDYRPAPKKPRKTQKLVVRSTPALTHARARPNGGRYIATIRLPALYL